MHAVSSRRLSPRSLVLSVSVLALLALLALAGRAQAAELLYWDNYDGDSVSFANGDGSGGGQLSTFPVNGPEGMAIDTVTGRLYVAAADAGAEPPATPEPPGIRYFNLDGSGGGVFTAPGAPMTRPIGVAIDPVGRMIYWANYDDGGVPAIVWAKLDGSAGGVLNTAGAPLNGPSRLAVDVQGGRLYWGDSIPMTTGATISYANLNNSGGGTLPLTGAAPPEDISGLAIDNATNRIYWLDNEAENVSYASLAGGGGADLNLAGANFDEPYGLALDPVAGRILWGNYDDGADRFGAIGFAGLAGGPNGGISIATAPLNGPQDPLILKSPTATTTPVLARNAKQRAQLTCSTGTWAADFAGSFVYQAPTTYAYQWTLDGAAVPTGTAATLSATKPGKYACAVTAANQAGSAAQSSAAISVKAAKAKLTVKRKVTVKAGKPAAFKLTIANQGDLKSKNAKVCAQLPKGAKGALKAPKCKSLGKLKTGKRKATVKIKTSPAASGTYKVTFKLKGLAGKPVKAKIQVLPAK